jgi:prepilin-type N-terminal cleavage/methylation domain-containing protein
MKRNERGMTLLETMVAVVILAIAILHMAMVPLLSQAAIRNSQASARATSAGRDKMEQFMGVLAKTRGGTPPYSGYDSLVLLPKYNNGNDSVVTADGTVLRRWRILRQTGPMSGADTGYATVQVVCRYKTGLSRYDSIDVTTYLAKRDTLPLYQP